MNILVVDDSAILRKMLRKVLAECNLPIEAIFEAGDGSQGLDVLAKETVQLILCDVNMPVMNGYEFLAKTRETPKFAAIPVLMVTTEGSQDSVLKAQQLGASGFIRKPFTPDEVKGKIAKCLQQAA
jgi:two-component system chemotaxis response regulator CheY